MNRTMATKAMSKSNEEANDELRRGPWTLEEDNLLIRYITCHGEGRWNLLAKCAGLKRTGKSCRLRWLNYLKPDIKHGNLTPHEQLLILELHSRWGNRWSKIAQQLQGRTDNEIKNYWRTRVQKQARQLKIDSSSKKFLEVIRCYYMPRLLEKMDQTSSSSASPTSSTLTMESQSSVVVPSELTNREPFVLSSQSRKVVEDFNHVTESSSSLISSELSPPLDSERKLELVPQFSGHPISPNANFCDNVYYYNALVDDSYHVESNKFGMEGPNQEEISGLCSPSISLLDCQMVDNDWLCDMNASTFWNMDELWQLRKQE